MLRLVFLGQAAGRRALAVPPSAVVVLLVGLGAAILGGLLAAAIHPLAGLAAIFGGGLAVAMLLSAEVGLIAVIGIAYLLPFGVIPVPIGGLRLTFLDAAITAVLAVWLLRLLSRRDERPVTTPLDGLVLIFVGLAIVSFVIGIYSVSGEMLRFFLKTINSILFFLTVTNVVRTKATLVRVVQAVLLGGLSAALLGIAFYVMDKGLAIQLLSSLRGVGYPSGAGVLRYIAGTTTLRATGTAIDPNVLGGMLLLVLPLAVSQLFAERGVLPRQPLALVVAAIALCLILTLSRGAWVGAVAAMLFLATVRYRRAWLLLGLVVALLLLVPQGELIVGRVEVAITAEDRATQMRLGEYRDALRLISLYPWFGVGFGSAPSVDLYVAAASIYLLMAEQMGLVGLSAFLLCMVVLFVWAFRAYRRMADVQLKALHIGVLSGVVGALSAGLFDHYFFNLHFPHTVALFWLFVGLTAAAARLEKEG